MRDHNVLKLVVIVGVILVSLFGINTYRSAKLAEIEREREIEIQIQETERTEERSQFWQKVVPWGDDEDEENK